MGKTRMTEEEKGKARVIATMCGGVIPAWAMPSDEEDEDEDDGEHR
jgi:hypothetical protein